MSGVLWHLGHICPTFSSAVAEPQVPKVAQLWHKCGELGLGDGCNKAQVSV